MSTSHVVRTSILLLITIMFISALAMVSPSSKADLPLSQPIRMHSVTFDRAVFLEMAIRERFGSLVDECFLGTSSWIGHEYVQGSEQLKRAFLDTGIESTCCTRFVYGHLICALLEQDLATDITAGVTVVDRTPVRLLKAISGDEPLIVGERVDLREEL